MGTWGPKPFENDAALDYVGGIIDILVDTLVEFVEGPNDYLYQKAVAAVTLLNRIMREGPSRPWVDGIQYDGRPVCTAIASHTTDNHHKTELDEFLSWTTPPDAAKAG